MEYPDKINVNISRERHNIPLNDTGSLEMSYKSWRKNDPTVGTTVISGGEKIVFPTCMWPHYMYKNQVARIVTELVRANRLPNVTGRYKDISCYGRPTIIEYKQVPSDSLSRLIKMFDTIDDDRVQRGLRFKHIHMSCDSLLSKQPTFELRLNCRGHYVAGSYVHDYEAAREYTAYLNDRFAPLHFKYHNYNSSNDHQYTFIVSINLTILDKFIDKMETKVATEGLYED